MIRCNEAGAQLRGLGGRCARGRGGGGLGVSWAWPGAQCAAQDPEAGGCASKEGVRQFCERTETTELHFFKGEGYVSIRLLLWKKKLLSHGQIGKKVLKA